MNLIVNLDKPLHPNIITFLKAQQCGFKNGYPNVCCKLLPSPLRVLKHISTSTPRGPELLPIPLPTRESPQFLSPQNNKIYIPIKSNLKSNGMKENDDLMYKLNVPTTSTTSPTHFKPVTKFLNRNFRKSQQLNIGLLEMFDSFDAFDLFRKRRGVFREEVEVEIR